MDRDTISPPMFCEGKNAALSSDLLHRRGGYFVIESTVLNPDTELNMGFRAHLFRFDSDYWPPVGELVMII